MKSSTRARSPADSEVLARIVELACQAPSVHNTQPWVWRAGRGALELYADHHRQLPVTDPAGRSMVISCGAALHHAQVAARALGWRPLVSRRPESEHDHPLARIELEPAHPSAEAAVELQAMRDRCTDRRRFTLWPVPNERLLALVSAAVATGARAVAVTDPVDRVQVELAVSRAIDLQDRDIELFREQDRWMDRTDDGVPSAVVPADLAPSRSRRSRFGPGLLDESQRQAVDGSDGILALGGRSDGVCDWLVTGEALSALWLRATTEGLSVVPLSQAIEVEETRVTLAHGVLGGAMSPHVLVRVGWLPIGRSELTRTPRRPLEDVLRPDVTSRRRANDGLGPSPR